MTLCDRIDIASIRVPCPTDQPVLTWKGDKYSWGKYTLERVAFSAPRLGQLGCQKRTSDSKNTKTSTRLQLARACRALPTGFLGAATVGTACRATSRSSLGPITSFVRPRPCVCDPRWAAIVSTPLVVLEESAIANAIVNPWVIS